MHDLRVINQGLLCDHVVVFVFGHLEGLTDVVGHFAGNVGFGEPQRNVGDVRFFDRRTDELVGRADVPRTVQLLAVR